MDNTVDVMIPVDVEAAKALESPARREAVGRYVSSLLKGERARDQNGLRHFQAVGQEAVVNLRLEVGDIFRAI